MSSGSWCAPNGGGSVPVADECASNSGGSVSASDECASNGGGSVPVANECASNGGGSVSHSGGCVPNGRGSVLDADECAPNGGFLIAGVCAASGAEDSALCRDDESGFIRASGCFGAACPTWLGHSPKLNVDIRTCRRARSTKRTGMARRASVHDTGKESFHSDASIALRENAMGPAKTWWSVARVSSIASDET